MLQTLINIQKQGFKSTNLNFFDEFRYNTEYKKILSLSMRPEESRLLV